MKKMTTLIVAGLFATTAFAGNGDDEKVSLNVDAKKSQIFWTGEKLTGKHTGTLSIKSGTIEVQDGVPVKVDVQLDMTSIVVTDIEDPGTNAKLLGHLKSDDFFSVASHPAGRFVATSFTPIQGAKGREENYTVRGELTLKGITKPVEFTAYINAEGTSLQSNANFKINRTHWDIKYGSGSFFDDLGDRAIYDDIGLVLQVSAEK